MLGQLRVTWRGELKDKVQISIDRLQAFAPPDGYFVAFSGGKDSQCVYHLCEMAGVPFDAHYSVTGVDPPELIYFIRDHYPKVSMDIPHDEEGNRISMWNLIAHNTMPPTQKYRYCCEKLKETNGMGRVTVTGVRWAESSRRKALHDVVGFVGRPKDTKKKADEIGATYQLNKNGNVIMNDDNDENRRMVEQCYRTRKTIVNPIVDWEDDDVWEFLNDVVKVPHCSLYDEGFKRIGCIGCPMHRKKGMEADFDRWPKYKNLYLKAFEKMVKNRPNHEWYVVNKQDNTPPPKNNCSIGGCTSECDGVVDQCESLKDEARLQLEWWLQA